MKAFYLPLALMFWPALVPAAMVALEDGELSDVTGQALLVSDYIPPSGGAGSNTDFGFFRLALDAEVSVNMNIDRLQLGCGGFNDVIRAGCDIDLEYVSFMGLNPTKTGPAGNKGADAASRRAAVGSDMVLTRPYLELAIRNPTSVNDREIAGFKVGAQSVTGYFGVGCAPSSPGCGTQHRGINSFSGYLNAFMNGIVPFGTGLGDGKACIGSPPNPTTGAVGGYGPCPITAGVPEFYSYGNGVPVRVDGNDFSAVTADRTSTAFAGTRISELQIRGVILNRVHAAGGVIGLLNPDQMFASLSVRMNEVHGFIFNDTQDFGLSFQREDVAYPRYNKTTGYSYPASQGWWMNVPSVQLAGLAPAKVDACGLVDCLSAFSAPGLQVGYPDLKDTPPVNCYGTLRFC